LKGFRREISVAPTSEKLQEPHRGEGVEFAVFEELAFERELVGAGIPAEVKRVMARS